LGFVWRARVCSAICPGIHALTTNVVPTANSCRVRTGLPSTTAVLTQPSSLLITCGESPAPFSR
jgi:hypothetical protein